MAVLVSLRSVADGRIMDPRSLGSAASTTIREALKFRDVLSTPSLLRFGRFSPELYALLGVAQVRA